ncbi:hypothetical protein O3P69_005371 [Scylla paramamosain]|uniref:Uncharacterized protein n=1 Tax=Scylla paramamosain TaxID=85552 RepID=A0AAW0U9L3_SCYPA
MTRSVPFPRPASPTPPPPPSSCKHGRPTNTPEELSPSPAPAACGETPAVLALPSDASHGCRTPLTQHVPPLSTATLARGSHDDLTSDTERQPKPQLLLLLLLLLRSPPTVPWEKNAPLGNRMNEAPVAGIPSPAAKFLTSCA